VKCFSIHRVSVVFFSGNNGQLYIGVGGNTNAGLPGSLTGSQRQRENFFSAAVLVAHLAKPGFNGFITYDAEIDGTPLTGHGPNGVEIFAAGVRNPYGVLLHSNDKVYATDNGSNVGLGNRATGCGPGQNATAFDTGDKLYLLKRGGYYGHPNHKRAQTDPRQCVWRSADEPSDAQYTAPILKVESSTDGIIEFVSDHFKGQMRGDLILSKYNDALFRVILSPYGETVNPFSSPMIRLAGQDGLAVTQVRDGSLMDVRHATSKCFRYTPVEEDSTEMEIKAVFPRRGALAGGSKFMIFGTNFNGSPTVTVGGSPCTNVVVKSANKIECRLPVGTVGRKNVVVTIGAVSDTFANGYRYITGQPL
jgi:IPT/TIG domain/Glucose / Sorbosone dehydrogenase